MADCTRPYLGGGGQGEDVGHVERADEEVDDHTLGQVEALLQVGGAAGALW